MSWAIATCFAIVGFAGLSQAMKKHQREIFGAALAADQNRLYQRTGWVFILACSAVCIAAFGWSFGLVALCGVATIAALSVIGLLTFRPKWLTYLCPFPRWLGANGGAQKS